MRARGARLRRSGAEWAVRGGLAVAALAFGYVGVTRSLASCVKGVDPALAHVLAPEDGRITALVAQGLAGAEAGLADRTKADRLAQQALRQDATSLVAASTLGIDAQVRGETEEARQLFGYAEALSRRDLQTQVWAIENAVGRGDLPVALRHYDIALRTSRNAQDLLFPILASAIATEPVRRALTGVLAQRPVWGPHFLGYAVWQGQDPRVTALLFLALRRAGIPAQEETTAQLVDRLATNVSPLDAWTFYASNRSGVERRMSRDPRFRSSLPATMFDWRPIDGVGVTATIQTAVRGGLVDFAAAAGVGGVALQQMQVLPPGKYRLVGHSIAIEQAKSARPYWRLSCLNGQELGRVALPNSAEQSGIFVGWFTVPSDCAAQILSLVVRPSDAIAGASGQIDRVQLEPLA